MDFPIKFARDLVARVPPGKRPDQLRAAKGIVTESRAAEVNKVAADLAKLGIDWSDAPPEAGSAQVASTSSTPLNVDVKVETDRPQNEVVAGEPVQLKVTVTNKGTVPLYRLNAMTKSDNPMFENKELVFGKLEPGKSRSATAPLGWCEVEGHKVGSTAPLPKDAPRVCRIPRDALTRSDGIKIHFEEARGHAPPDAEARVAIKALERPIFAYGYQILDNRKGNGDGRVQKGEQLTMYLTVKNVGRGRSFETQANLRNLSGDGLLLHEGRFDISDVQPGQTKKVAFTFDVEPSLGDPEAKVELSIADRDLRENVAEKVRMPIALPLAITPQSGTFRARSNGASLFESPDGTARVFARLPAGASAPSSGTVGDFVKLTLGEGRFGFARQAELEPTAGLTGPLAFEDTFGHAPPAIEVGAPELATRNAHTIVKGTASDMDRLLDAYIFVGARKVFYRSNRNGTDPKKMSFEADLPLRPGVNIVTVVSRENPDTTGRKTFIIRRDGANGELLQTPKTDDELGEATSATED
jgi:carboxyl-terminal processing protease